jgi:uncharacterized protein YqhQ
MALFHARYGEVLILLSLIVALFSFFWSSAQGRGALTLRRILAGLLDLEILIGLITAALVSVPWGRFIWHPLAMIVAAVFAHLAARRQDRQASWFSALTVVFLLLGFLAARSALA